MLAPCFIDDVNPNRMAKENKTLMTYQEKADIHAISGPNWDNDYESMCRVYGKNFCKNNYGDAWWSEGQSVKSDQHEAQNALTDRFQEFVPLDKWLDGETISELVPLENIQNVPITFIAGAQDGVCVPEQQK